MLRGPQTRNPNLACKEKYLGKRFDNIHFFDLLVALKYRSVTDIVRPISKIVHRGEKGIGHSV